MKKKTQSRSAKGRFQIQEEEPIMLTKSTDPAVRPSTPLAYAQSACDTMMRRYAAADLPPKGHFHYHQGVFLSGVFSASAMRSAKLSMALSNLVMLPRASSPSDTG